MKQVELTRGQVTRIDDHHYSWVVKNRWSTTVSTNGEFYASRITSRLEGHQRIVYLHVEIMEHILGRSLMNDEEVDHIDLDKLNNLDENLRLATHSENMRNKPRRSDNTSGYKGVTWKRSCDRWCSRITVNGKLTHLGYFTDVKDAARAYDQAAKELHGKFARLNFPTNP